MSAIQPIFEKLGQNSYSLTLNQFRNVVSAIATTITSETSRATESENSLRTDLTAADSTIQRNLTSSITLLRDGQAIALGDTWTATESNRNWYSISLSSTG